MPTNTPENRAGARATTQRPAENNWATLLREALQACGDISLCLSPLIACPVVGGVLGAGNGFFGYNVIERTGGDIAKGFNLENTVIANAIGGAIFGMSMLLTWTMMKYCHSN